MRFGCCLFPMCFPQLCLLRAPYMFRVLKSLPKDMGRRDCGRWVVFQIFHNTSCMLSLPKPRLRANGIRHKESLADKCHRQLKESRESGPCSVPGIKETNTYFKVSSLDYTFSHTSPHNWHSIWINPIMRWKAPYKTFQFTSMWVILEWRNVLKTVPKTLCWRMVAFTKRYDVAVKTQFLSFCSIIFVIIKLVHGQNKFCELTVSWLKQRNE